MQQWTESGRGVQGVRGRAPAAHRWLVRSQKGYLGNRALLTSDTKTPDWLGFSSVSAFSSQQLDHTFTLDPYP